MKTDLAIVLAAAALATALVLALIVNLVQRLRSERAAQAPQGRSPMWALIAFGVVAYLMAYIAFEGDLQVPIRLALIGMGIASIPVVRRIMR